ncbi:MAG TPA: GNAT family N-acetyltransferase, partial [Acidimicrobiales bacterium]|nr:GNAT family N-acetyltransferase [Acidimicrobiales bacterium]
MPSSRHRLGVALLLDEPVRSEVEGLRRAVGDPSLGRMDPHVTLVPPVNVRPADLPAALSAVRAAAASQQGPLVATLGPPATFMPDNPVLYLEVGGELDRLARLRDDVFEPPLARALTWPWIPHVTLGDGIAEERIAGALAVMGDYASLATFDRVVLLEERSGRRWAPIADACLGPPAVIGTGGITVTITRSRLFDPEARSLVADAFNASEPTLSCPPILSNPPILSSPPILSGPIVLTARTEDGVAGFAGAWLDNSGAHAGVFVSESCRRQGIGSHLLAHLESTARDVGWEYPAVQAEGPAGFYESRSAWVRPPAGEVATRTRRTSSGRA